MEKVEGSFNFVGELLKNKKSTWPKSCKESLKRDQEVLVVADELKAQGNVDENTKAMITPVLKRIRKIMEEGEAAKEHRTGRCPH